MQQTIRSIQELQEWVTTFLDDLEPQTDSATVVTLSGDLGVGKTALVKCCARYFGITDEITSPTFVIQKEYEIQSHPQFSKLVHIDAYRLNSASELEYLKWEETISDPHTIVFLEWPQMVPGIPLPSHTEVNLDMEENHDRTVFVKRYQ